MSDENTQASSPSDANENPQASSLSDAYDNGPPTAGFPAYEPPPPTTNYPSQPQWSAPAPAPVLAVRLRVRDHALVALSVVLAMVVVVGLGYMWVGDSIVSVQRIANDGQPNGQGNAATNGQNGQNGQADKAEPGATGSDLREGAVFLASNNAAANEAVAFARNADGSLREVGRYATGGKGSGTIEDISQSLVLGTADGEASPTQNVDKAELLFVPNGGSNTISVFRIKADGLELASEVASGGEKPISLAVSKGLLYVLNSGEYDDFFVTGPTSFVENCTTGQLPSVTGFRVTPDGNLTQIEGSTRPLSGAQESGCAQIGFAPDGKTLIATERIAGKRNAETGYGKGAITTYGVRKDGTLTGAQVQEPIGNGPYGFTFTKEGTLLVAEQNGAHLNPNGGFVASYTVNGDSTLKAIGGSVASTATDTCWIVLHGNQKLVFASSPFGGGAIGSFSVGKDGAMTLLHSAASAADGRDVMGDNIGEGVLDVGVSRDSKYLYALDGLAGGLYAFRVTENGTLTFIDKYQVFNLLGLAEGGAGGPNGIASF